MDWKRILGNVAAVAMGALVHEIGREVSPEPDALNVALHRALLRDLELELRALEYAICEVSERAQGPVLTNLERTRERLEGLIEVHRRGSDGG